MFWNKYIFSCMQCKTEYEHNGKKVAQAFIDGCKNRCPACGRFLKPTPLSKIHTPMPENLKSQNIHSKTASSMANLVINNPYIRDLRESLYNARRIIDKMQSNRFSLFTDDELYIIKCLQLPDCEDKKYHDAHCQIWHELYSEKKQRGMETYE